MVRTIAGGKHPVSQFPKTETYLLKREAEILAFMPQVLRDYHEQGLDQRREMLDLLDEVRGCMDEINA